METNITAHLPSDGLVHCWFEDDVPLTVEDRIEDIETKVFNADRNREGIEILENLPQEGHYDHDPIVVGTISYKKSGEITDISLDLDSAEEQLRDLEYV